MNSATPATTAVTPDGFPYAGSNVSLRERAYRIRRHALPMGEVQGQGYIAQALGIADVLAVSCFRALRYRPDDVRWEGRDRFLLSIGHYVIVLYAALIEAGILPESESETYGTDGSRLPMSGMAAYTPGMEITGGSLGHGVGIVDANDQQADGPSSAISSREPLHERFRAFGWHTRRVDGNDIDAVAAAFDAARAAEVAAPRIVICDTRMAKGVPFLEAREHNHFLRVEPDEWQQAIALLDAIFSGKKS
ncbi:MAG: transketolase [Acetobacteraceae bacterium]